MRSIRADQIFRIVLAGGLVIIVVFVARLLVNRWIEGVPIPPHLHLIVPAAARYVQRNRSTSHPDIRSVLTRYAH